MANRFWVGGTASWDGTAGTKWSTTDGGAGGSAIPTSSDDVFFTALSGANTITIAAGNTGCLSVDCTGFTGTLTGSAALTCSGNYTLVAGMTYSYTGALTMSGTGATLAGAGKTFGAVTFSGITGNTSITGANTFDTLTFTGGANAQANVSLAANQICSGTGTFTATGNSVTNRLFVKSSTVGTPRTVTAVSVSITDVDFQDTAGAGAASPFTGTRIGDCKGNSGITATTPASKFYVGNSANWTGTVWATISGGVAAANNYPLPQDTAVLDANSFNANGQTITLSQDSRRIGTLTCSGTDQTFTVACNGVTSPTFFGDLTLESNAAQSGSTAFVFSGRGAQAITTAGVTWGSRPLTIDSLGGTVSIADSFTAGTTTTVTLTQGTLDLNGTTLSSGRFSSSNSNARTIKSTAAGGKIVTTDTTATTVFTAATSTSLTVTRNSWTIEIGGNTTNIRTANLGSGITWPALTFTNTTASGELDIVSSGTTTVLKSLAVSTPPQTIKRTAATTIAIEDNNGFPSGSGANLVTIGSITAASHTWTKSGGGLVSVDKLSISRSTVTPANTFYAGTGSTDGGNNSGWNFRLPPDRDAFMHFFQMLLCVGLLTLLMACAAGVTVRYVAVADAELAKACPSMIGASKGCTSCDDAGCTIYAPAPKNLEDEDRLLTIGHEFYCHAWLKQSHYDNHGRRKDPSVDCRGER